MATKKELEKTIDSAIETLSEAYTPETTREDLAAAVGEALDILNGEDEDSDDSTIEDEDESELDEDSEDADGGCPETAGRFLS